MEAPRSPQAARDPRPPAQGLRPPAPAPPPGAGGRADPHRPLPEHERPQPRRGLRPPARALPGLARRARRARGRGGGGHPAGRHLAREVGAHPADPAGHRRGRPVAARHDAAGRGARLAVPPARRGPQDRGVRAAVRVRPARHPGGHARVPRGHAARPVPARRLARGGARRHARDDAIPTTRTRCTSPSSATGGAPVTRATPSAPSARCSASAPRARRAWPRPARREQAHLGRARAHRHRGGVGPHVRDGAGRHRAPARDGLPRLPLHPGRPDRGRGVPRAAAAAVARGLASGAAHGRVPHRGLRLPDARPRAHLGVERGLHHRHVRGAHAALRSACSCASGSARRRGRAPSWPAWASTCSRARAATSSSRATASCSSAPARSPAHILVTARSVRHHDVGALLAVQLGLCGLVLPGGGRWSPATSRCRAAARCGPPSW